MNRSAALPAETRIGNCVLIDVLGQGGGAITYYCTDTLLGREVALKEHFPQGLCRRMSDGRVAALPGMEEVFEQSVELFLREAQTVAGVRHPHIMRIHEVQPANGTAYAVLELEEGQLLDAWLTAHAQEPPRIQRMLETLLDVLAYLHERSVYHRDIKPANILVREGDDPVLLDFGAAHVGDFTGMRTIVGTPLYAAPEQFSQEGEVGSWSDLYALGMSFLQGLGAESVAALPRRLRRSLYRATRKQPERRFRSAAEWKRALRPRRYLPWVAGAGVFALAAAVAGGAWYFLHKPAEEPAASASPVPAAAPQEQPDFTIADIPRKLDGYTLRLLVQDQVCFQSKAELQHAERMEEEDVINALKDAFFAPDREPINARLNPNYFIFGDKTWRVGESESDYSYKRLEASALGLLWVTNVSKTHRMPYLLWFSSPTEGLLAFPVDNGLNVWSRVLFRLEPTEGTEEPLRPKGTAPESPAGMYLLMDRSLMQRYSAPADSPAAPDAEAEKTRMEVSPFMAYRSALFRDEAHWESGSLTGTYTYERLNDKTARITLHMDGFPEVLSYYLEFSRSTTGRMCEHQMGGEESHCNIIFEMQPFGVSPHGQMFNTMFTPEELRPTADSVTE
ncbi:MAG: serine/threonine protein kinase [Akkermansia sp.]|nr:serine/threonine protein kinase [Akkermansia sp.]